MTPNETNRPRGGDERQRTDAVAWAVVSCVVGAAVAGWAGLRIAWPTLATSRAGAELLLVLGAVLIAVGAHRLLRALGRAKVLAWPAAVAVLVPVALYFIITTRATNAFDRNEDLLRAVVSGSATEVARLLEEGADPNYESRGVSMLAFAEGKPEIVALLRAAGARPIPTDGR